MFKKLTQEDIYNRIPESIAFNGVGESFYRHNIITLMQPRTTTEHYLYEVLNADVCLVLEPNNQYDKNAVMIMVNDVLIGYVPRNHARSVGRFKDYYTFTCSISSGPTLTNPENNFSVIVKGVKK